MIPLSTMEELSDIWTRRALGVSSPACAESSRDAVPNDRARIMDAAPVTAVFCTGAAAAQAYRRFSEPKTGIACVQLPATSPANAAMGLDALVGDADRDEVRGLPRDAGGRQHERDDASKRARQRLDPLVRS